MDIQNIINEASKPINRPIRGASNGRADEVPTVIKESGEEAALSHGEYVLTAETVSKLGGGNTEAGIEYLDDLLEIVKEMDAEQASLLGQVLVSFARTVLDETEEDI